MCVFKFNKGPKLPKWEKTHTHMGLIDKTELLGVSNWQHQCNSTSGLY